MDISLAKAERGALISPLSIHGMLWLQTHFEETHWEALAAKQVILPLEDIDELSTDLAKAGLLVDFCSSLLVSKQI